MAERSDITEMGRKGGERLRSLVEKGRDAISEAVGRTPSESIRKLIEDHNKVKQLLREAENAEGEECMRISQEIFKELTLHTRLEEEVFYPFVKERGDETLASLVNEAFQEHHLVKILIDEMKQLSANDDAFQAKLEVLQENVEHHIDEEENEMFTAVRKQLDADQMAELDRQMKTRREELKQQIQ